MPLSSVLKAFPEANVCVGIQQKIDAASNFDGTAPVATGLDFHNGINKFVSGTAGGLFNFENEMEVVTIEQYQFEFGGSVTWTLSIVSLDDAAGTALSGEAWQIATGTAVRVFSTTRIRLLPSQALKLVTTGGAGAMVALVMARTERGSQG